MNELELKKELNRLTKERLIERILALTNDQEKLVAEMTKELERVTDLEIKLNNSYRQITSLKGQVAQRDQTIDVFFTDPEQARQRYRPKKQPKKKNNSWLLIKSLVLISGLAIICFIYWPQNEQYEEN